ncbi:hypothetical protein MGA447_1546 [Enterococcus faecalis]|nr:hypothetical protein MGA447_1546 [Enterococcus faecalis]OSH28597.1 hypothetical protein QH294_0555 [Enterococcus faecalis]OSH39083.1 hypothetical protein XM264_1187 [Enterococcus faecalis]
MHESSPTKTTDAYIRNETSDAKTGRASQDTLKELLVSSALQDRFF